MEHIDLSLIDWSRAQFALTAMFHWLFVPLTLGLGFILAFMETMYYRTGDPEWKRITKFWATLFGVNFAIGVATGIILEFEFGTNWSNYSWFVGDIFGAPLAVEGILAFFLESTFIAVMFFGWDKVSKRFHLISTWLVAGGANLSALWILVANAWMQNPVGMEFNMDTARNEMTGASAFWEVLFSPIAINKFLHTVSSAYILAAVFVVGVSSWYMLKKRDVLFAKRSMIVASAFGLPAILLTILTGDGSARLMARHQPMKFAAMESHWDGGSGAPLIAFAIVAPHDEADEHRRDEVLAKIEIPNLLSYMAYQSADAYVPGISDLVHGNQEQGIMSYTEKIEKGKLAIASLKDYKRAREANDSLRADTARTMFMANYPYLGYGYFDNPHDLIPNVPLVFYSFRFMVGIGLHFVILMFLILYFSLNGKIESKRWLFRVALWSIPLAYLASQAGWVVAEVGRQPWVIQDLMPTLSAVSQINTHAVQLTFWLFLATFSVLLIAEIRILLAQIKKGPNTEGGN
jgi:cytochrome d ubiquinol oxidase subunit I